MSFIDEDVDVVNLNRASPVLKMSVYSRGKLVYCNNHNILFLDQNRAVKLYDDYPRDSRGFERILNEL